MKREHLPPIRKGYAIPTLPLQEGVRFCHCLGCPGYCVGDDGSVWGCRGPHGFRSVWRCLKQQLCGPSSTDMYLYVNFSMLCQRGGSKRVNRLVLESFVGPCPEGMECCHRDGNRFNNCLDNLRWGTRSSNREDQRIHGTLNQGSRNGNSKLKESDIVLIRQLLLDGRSQKSLARQFKVTKPIIQGIRRREIWRHVP